MKGVITPMDKYEIIRRYQKNESLRSISRETGVNRKTVRKYCYEYDELMSELEKGEIEAEIVQEKIISKPSYDSSNRRKYRYTEEIDKLLDEILESESRKDKLLGNHKQGLTQAQIHQQIVDAGHKISQSTISQKIKKKLDKAKECFIKQSYELGDRLEFDFGEVKLIVKGEKKNYHLAVLSSPGGNYRWAYLYNNQKKEVFLDAHVRFFEMMGGTYKEVVYDNMKNVVTKFLGKNEKQLNEDLLKLSVYYGFDINVTNAFRGNEKGHVEGSVKIIRKAIYGEKYEFSSYESACEYLQHRLLKMNESTNIEEEKKHLIPYKPPLDLAEIRTVTVNKYSFARIMNNSYSLPDYLVKKKLIAKIYHDRIKFYSNEYFVCEHKKIDGANEISIDIRHYLTTFKKKPGAIRNSLALKSMHELKSIYDIYFKSKPKEFIELLEKYQELEYTELIIKLKNHTRLNSSPIKNESIQIITKNQLDMYNNLSIGRRH